MSDMNEQHTKQANKRTKSEFEYETISSSYGSEITELP
jgi:hypothetical protein